MSVDPTWLNAPGRVFPATLDLPIVTAYSAGRTGLWGTVNSCAPNTPAPSTEVVVGATGDCTYNGQAYFDLTSLPLDTPIVSATLRLYTPAQTTSTGVAVYPNAPGATFDFSDDITAMRADRLLKLDPQPYPYGPHIIPGDESAQVRRQYLRTIEEYERYK